MGCVWGRRRWWRLLPCRPMEYSWIAQATMDTEGTLRLSARASVGSLCHCLSLSLSLSLCLSQPAAMRITLSTGFLFTVPACLTAHVQIKAIFHKSAFLFRHQMLSYHSHCCCCSLCSPVFLNQDTVKCPASPLFNWPLATKG